MKQQPCSADRIEKGSKIHSDIENQIRRWHEIEDEESWRAIQIRESLMRAPIGKTRMAMDAAIEMIWGTAGSTEWAPRDVRWAVSDECGRLARALLHRLVDDETLSARYGIERQSRSAVE